MQQVREEDRKPGGGVLTAFGALVTAVFVVWAVLPLTGLDTHRYVIALVSLTPYAVPCGALLLVVALMLRRWLIALVVALTTAGLVVGVAPRALTDEQPAEGAPLRMLSINTHLGEASPERIVDLVRTHRVDVLSVQELTPGLAAALDRAGLTDVLPHRVYQPAPGGEGTGIASRFPAAPLSLVPETTLNQPSARIDVPGAGPVEVVAVHPIYPVGADTAGAWSRELAALPDPPAEDAPPRVLAGDFNATLDHTRVRAMLGRGYTDAADATGSGLLPTWPDGWFPPPVTIDHVLVSEDIGVRGYRTYEVPGADHRAILADLVVTPGGTPG
ncbi:endonuclease/exonuclease/phosphatase family protein [Saccharopolyspora sp. CA-218241]|uniref:endonuclease/exonuclease/phosphatase family protein n=1 Tax=Saccharopolyspora sp. CA-218241 TaxID=3240027 RepID=UPI003D96ABFD